MNAPAPKILRLVERAAGLSTAADWEGQLQRSGNGTGVILATPSNAFLILRNHPDWTDVIGFDQFAGHVVKLAAPPFHDGAEGRWTDADDSKAMQWIAENYGVNIRTPAVAEAVQLVASHNTFNPVLDWLLSLKWDGTVRLDAWLQQYLGVKATPYTAAVGPKILIAAIARVMQPGCKVDAMPIFEGPQGIGKSTAIKILAGRYYGETAITIGDKDSLLMMIAGFWIIELGELESLNRIESTRAKQFLSTATDAFRPPYGRRTEIHQRGCVFWGTTNSSEYLRDETGGRRFWPIKCGRIDLAALQRDRDQLWAEALVRFGESAPWHVLPKEVHLFNSEQDARYFSDAWEEKLAAYLENSKAQRVPFNELYTGALGLELKDVDRQKQMRVAACLQRIRGWRKVRASIDGQQVRMVERDPE